MEQSSGRKRESGRRNNSKGWDALPGEAAGTGCPGWELQGDPSQGKWETGCGTARKEEDKILGKNLWNDLEKILWPQKVGTWLGCAQCWDQGLRSLRESVKNEAGKMRGH